MENYAITHFDRIENWKDDDGLKTPKTQEELIEELIITVNHIIDSLSEGYYENIRRKD